jgi:hypothetical protein
MTTETQGERMKLTKRLQAVLDRWGTAIRKPPTQVYHMTHRTTTPVEPLVFAVFETLIKAVYGENISSPPVAFENCSWEEYLANQHHWYSRIAAANGFTLKRAGLPSQKQCYEDYHYCRSMILKANLYYKLLD